MCGKFTQMSTWQEVHAFSQPLVADRDGADLVVATPMRMARIMRMNPERKRELVAMRWGFAAVDDRNPTRPKHMHARAETVEELRTFAHAFAQARGILMVHTFNEGEELPNGRTKQWVIAPKDRQPVALAVICEKWTNGTEVLDTFVMLTTPANALISRITDRMPAILPREAWPIWLGETDASPDTIKAVLRTYEDGGNWTMTEQAPSRPPSKRKPPSSNAQQELF